MTDAASALHSALSAVATSLARNKLEVFYSLKPSMKMDGGPYTWQGEFHNAGSKNRMRAMICANRVGKTRPSGAEVACHLMGWYPSWWKGRKFDHPIDCIVAAPSAELFRDQVQKELFGELKEGERAPSGQGWVAADKIVDFSWRQGVSSVLDTVRIRHSSGGLSKCLCKSYEQGPVKFQALGLDLVWLDEEPDKQPWEIFSECMTRLVDKGGILMFSRTPLFGMSDIVRFFVDGGPGIWMTQATWDDAPHLSPENREEYAAGYAKHERDTRTKGVPMMGSGAVYTISDEDLLVEPIEIPKHWARICGVDFGIDHPGACAWLAHDRDADILYITDAYKMSGETPAYHAQAIMGRGKWIPVAWPHDGMVRDKGTGHQLAAQYRVRGVNMLELSSRFDDEVGGSQPRNQPREGRESSTIELLERMLTGRFKVFDNPGGQMFLAEKRMLHRKDGMIVPTNDDVESAVRYGMMMLRYAEALGEQGISNLPKMSEDWDPLDDFTREPRQRYY